MGKFKSGNMVILVLSPYFSIICCALNIYPDNNNTAQGKEKITIFGIDKNRERLCEGMVSWPFEITLSDLSFSCKLD